LSDVNVQNVVKCCYSNNELHSWVTVIKATVMLQENCILYEE